jgi:hypothetical protein
LSATALDDRLAQMADLGRDALLGVEQAERRASVRFAADAGIPERLARIVAAESECCAFLAMWVSDQPDGVVLTIEAPEGAELAAQEIVDAFRGERKA